MGRKPSLLVVIMVFLLAACSSGGGGSVKPRPSTALPRPSTTGKVVIVSPKKDESIKGSTVTLKVAVTGARIIQETKATGASLRPDEVHLHVSLDGEGISMSYGTEQAIPDVVPGLHAMRVELVAADHFPFNPRVFTEVSFRTRS